MSDALAFVCEGCGLSVFQLRGRYAPAHGGFCAVCEWLNEHVPPHRIMDDRRRMEPGGWDPEPRHGVRK